MKLKKVAAIGALLVMGLWSLPSAALELGEGFFDIPWGEQLAKLEGFEPLGKHLEVSYYAKPDRIYQIENIEVANVVYGFFNDRFFAVYLAVDRIDVFGQLRRYIQQKYGTPRITKTKSPPP